MLEGPHRAGHASRQGAVDLSMPDYATQRTHARTRAALAHDDEVLREVAARKMPTEVEGEEAAWV